jgi:nitroimidazol reductase NimA-like FMN-containing flavoprotein (pyridoxamine 5'-phosphate oxidase superfamily)
MIKDLERYDCLEILKTNYLGRLCYTEGMNSYVVPITYFFDANDNSILSYASEGHKIVAMRNSITVSLLVDSIKTIKEWESVLVHGTFEELNGSSAKKSLHNFAEGVQNTIADCGGEHPRFIADFSARMSQGKMPIVYKIKISDVTGKFRTS